MTTECLDTERLTLRQLHQALKPELEQLDVDGLEYFSLSCEIQYSNKARLDQPIGRYRWLACYPVTGGSEGHYVHVDRIWQPDPYKREEIREPLFLVKTFAGWARAATIAAHLGARLGA